LFSALANMLHSPVSISQIISALHSISNGLITQHTSPDERHLRRLLLEAAQIKLEIAGKSNSLLTDQFYFFAVRRTWRLRFFHFLRSLSQDNMSIKTRPLASNYRVAIRRCHIDNVPCNVSLRRAILRHTRPASATPRDS
jgi:hypothetical protein